MARKCEDREGSSQRSPKARRDSGYAPLSADEENDSTETLSQIKTGTAAHVPEYVLWICVPLLSWEDVQSRGRKDISSLDDSNKQDRVLGTLIRVTVSEVSFVKISRYADTFKHVQKKVQIKHRRTPTLVFTSNLGRRATNAIKSPHTAVRSERASSEVTTWSSLFDKSGSSRSNSSSSLETIAEEKPRYERQNRKQEILQQTTWRSPVKFPQHIGQEIISIPSRGEVIAATIKARQAAIESQFGHGTLQSFHPSHRALRRQGVLQDYELRRESNSSTRLNSPAAYRGDPNVERNRSANIPDNENCAVWVWGLPSYLTYTALLNAIRGIGKVYAVVINPPNGSIRTSAAKIVFFRRYQAERLFDIINKGLFVVMGKVVQRIAWNKIKTGAYPHQSHSRAIRITGPANLMDFDFFEDFFLNKFEYDLDRRGEVCCNRPGMVSHEWHFGSLRCQAASAKTAIEREFRGIFEVEWAVDPCECA